MKVGIDTDRILDMCSCGERAGFYIVGDGRVYRPSAPVNVSREMGEYFNREAARVMG